MLRQALPLKEHHRLFVGGEADPTPLRIAEHFRGFLGRDEQRVKMKREQQDLPSLNLKKCRVGFFPETSHEKHASCIADSGNFPMPFFTVDSLKRSIFDDLFFIYYTWVLSYGHINHNYSR